MKTFLAALVVAFASFHVYAIPDLGTITGNPLYAGLNDQGDQLFQITDVDGVDDDITGILVLEAAGFAGTNESFLYNPADPTMRLTLFDGPSAVNDSVVITFDGASFSSSLGGSIPLASPVFGLGLSVLATGETYFSQNALNPDGERLMANYLTEGQGGLLGAFEQTIAWEDVHTSAGGDGDFNDHVYAVTDVSSVAVDEPSTLFLMGASLLGFGLLGRARRA